MSGVSTYTYTTLTNAIRDYTEVDSSVLTTTVVDGIIMAAEMRINQELPMDGDRFVQEGAFSTDNNTINAPAGLLIVLLSVDSVPSCANLSESIGSSLLILYSAAIIKPSKIVVVNTESSTSV